MQRTQGWGARRQFRHSKSLVQQWELHPAGRLWMVRFGDMTAFVRIGVAVLLLMTLSLLWYLVASDYGDGVVAGTYHLAQNGETSTLVLKPDHSFQQELNRSGVVRRAAGSWHRFGEAGIEFSREFLEVSGQELDPHGIAYGHIEKKLGIWVSLTLSQYHVLWYGKTDPSHSKTVAGTYTRDEEGVSAALVLKPDHTFVQTVSHLSDVKHTQGTWNSSQNGDVVFSSEFLKTSGEALRRNETASALDPEGSNYLQIQIAMISKSGVPAFWKNFPW